MARQPSPPSVEHQQLDIQKQILEEVKEIRKENKIHSERILDELREIRCDNKKSSDKLIELVEAGNALLQQLVDDQAPEPELPTSILFKESTMNPTQAGQTQVFTGTLVPAGAVYPADSTFTITSNDPAVAPTVDSTGLIVSVTYPDGWVESTTTPLAFQYAAASASNPTMAVSATITPSAPPAILPTGITFVQTT